MVSVYFSLHGIMSQLRARTAHDVLLVFVFQKDFSGWVQIFEVEVLVFKLLRGVTVSKTESTFSSWMEVWVGVGPKFGVNAFFPAFSMNDGKDGRQRLPIQNLTSCTVPPHQTSQILLVLG